VTASFAQFRSYAYNKKVIKISCDRPFSFGWIHKDRRKAWFVDFGLEDLRAWVAAEAVAAAAAEAAAAAVEITAAVAAVEKRIELWDCVLGKYKYVIQTGTFSHLWKRCKNLFILTVGYLKLYFYKIIFIFITELNAIENAWADTAALYLATNWSRHSWKILHRGRISGKYEGLWVVNWIEEKWAAKKSKRLEWQRKSKISEQQRESKRREQQRNQRDLSGKENRRDLSGK
jgi:hypothetical protein